MKVKSNLTIIGPVENPDEIVLSLFREPYGGRTINPHFFRRGQKSSVAQRRYNQKMSNMRMINLIMNNFLSSDFFVTLTYKDVPQTLEMADNEFIRVLNNLKRFFRKKGIEFIYVGVTERGMNDRYHHHLVIKRTKGIEIKDIINHWNKKGGELLGYVDIKSIREPGIEGNKLKADNDIEAVYYVAKYLVKSAISSTKKRFKRSKGLRKPVELNSDDIFTGKDYKDLCDNADHNENALLLIKKLCPSSNYELVDRRVIVKYIEGAGYYHVSARLRKAKKDSYKDFSMPEVFNFNYKKKDNSFENDMTAYKALEAWISQKQNKIPNLREIMDNQWREYTVKHISKYIKANMTMEDAIKAIDAQLQDQNNKNKFARILLSHIGKKMQNNVITQVEFPKRKKISESSFL